VTSSFAPSRAPLRDVTVLIVGQDPYPTPGHPIGLSFAVDAHVRPLPRSLQNIYRELADDLGIPPAPHGDLSAWSDQGVMLLNRVLTVAPGAPRSHRGWGWEKVTEHAIRTLAAREAPLVAILWGRDAANLRPLLGTTPIIESAHPRRSRRAGLLRPGRSRARMRCSSSRARVPSTGA
jgi:uracil-DNA glycosylase